MFRLFLRCILHEAIITPKPINNQNDEINRSFSLVAQRSTLSMKVDLVGSSAPLGFFDPLGFTKGADAATLTKYRESELKHGRTAMVCILIL
jgi:hypothetical protein